MHYDSGTVVASSGEMSFLLKKVQQKKEKPRASVAILSHTHTECCRRSLVGRGNWQPRTEKKSHDGGRRGATDAFGAEEKERSTFYMTSPSLSHTFCFTHVFKTQN